MSSFKRCLIKPDHAALDLQHPTIYESLLIVPSPSDSKHHVRPGIRPERAGRGHGKEDRAPGDQTGNVAQQLTGTSRPHQSGDQPATPGLPGGATPAL